MTENKGFSLDETIEKLEDNSELHDKISKDLDEYERNHRKNAIVDFKELQSFLNYLADKTDDDDKYEVGQAIVKFTKEKVTRISGNITK